MPLSKVLKQDFHYNYIKKDGDKAEMLLLDADSLMYKNETENAYEDLYKDKKLFDFSNYPKDSKYYNDANSILVGEMKDKTSGVPVKGFVVLNSKIYTFITEENHGSEKRKGIIKMFLMVNQSMEITKMSCSMNHI